MYLQIRLVEALLQQRAYSAQAKRSCPRFRPNRGAIWPKAATMGRAAGAAAMTKEEQKKRDPKFLRQG